MQNQWKWMIIMTVILFVAAPGARGIAQDANPAQQAAQMIQEEKYAEARDFIETTLGGDAELAANLRATLLFQLAYAMIELEEYRASINTWHRFIALVPQNAMVWGNLGWAYYLEGDLDSAIVATEHGLDLDGALTFAWGNMGLYRLANGDVDGMESAYAMALESAEDMDTWDAILYDAEELCAKGETDQDACDRAMNILDEGKATLAKRLAADTEVKE